PADSSAGADPVRLAAPESSVGLVPVVRYDEALMRRPAGLDVHEVSKRYVIPVLDAVSLQIEKGEFVCLLGPNGCGQPTLLRFSGGSAPPSWGEVRFDGRRVPYNGARDLHGGVVFQEDRLLPWMTLADNVTLVLRAQGLNEAARRATTHRYLRFVGLT